MELKRISSDKTQRTNMVLIVLYGIETCVVEGLSRKLKVLIVLYGIETMDAERRDELFNSLNRTLWN